MSDTISKSALLKQLDKDAQRTIHDAVKFYLIDLSCEIEDGRFDTDGWISVKDRLPEEDGLYLVYTHHGRDVGRFEKDKLGNWYVFISDEFDNFHWVRGHVSHWMPLPEPPKGEDTE